jgi:uncharacterized protein YqgC (DUF456 family)
MDPQTAGLMKLVAWIVVVLGLVGIFVPVLPGTVLVFAGALLWAWADGFQHLGWPAIAALALLTAVAEGAKYLTQVAGARTAGATWKGMLASAIGAIVGLLVFSIPGALIGAVGALLIVDYRQHGGDWRKAGKLTAGVLLGYLASYAVQFAIALVMVAILVYSALQ